MTTISNNTTIGITLSSPTYTNPIVVNPGVTISNSGIAVYAASGYWTIQNRGTISSINSYGIDLLAGGSVTNAASAAISGYADGLDIRGAAGTVVNSGDIAGATLDGVYLFSGGLVSNAAVITGYVDGVALGSGGSVTNAASATISGGIDGVYVASAAGTVVNSGSIAGYSTYGVKLLAGGTITNATSGTIYGYRYGVGLIGGGSVTNAAAGTIVGGFGVVGTTGTVLNSGIITGAAYYGIELLSGGSITNVASASISGLIDGIFLDSGGTVTNAGTIAGGSGTAIVFGGAGSSLLVAEAGAVFSGAVVVSGGGTLDVVSAFTGAVQIDDTSTLEFAGPYVGAATFSGSSTGSGGTLKFDAGSTGPITVVNPNDTVIAQPGNDSWIQAIVSYTLPANVDTLLLFAGAQGTGNSDASGDALYALDTVNTQTLTGNSANDAFVVYNSADVVVPKGGSHDTVYAAVNYTLPTGVDALLLEAGTQGVGNSDAAGDVLYAADGGIAQTLTGNSANDTFVVYNSADVVVPKAGSHDVVYSAVNYTLPTGVDVLFLEAGTQAVGNSDAAGDVLYAADAGIAQTLTGHSANDTFVVYNSADVVIGQAGSTDTLYTAANFTLPANVDTLLLEGNASRGTANSDANNVLYGNGGVASTLVAGGGADSLYVTGTAGTILTGGAGNDTFAFPNAMGHDEVTNFGVAKDTLQFNAALFANFTAAMNAASQVGANTVFTIDANNTVTLDNVIKTSLTAGNFHFS